jgi:hypothetical protein
MAEAATLKITRVTQDQTDPRTFVLHFNRTLTLYERKTVPGMLMDGGFAPDEVAGPDSVTIRSAHKQFFKDPTIRARLKRIVADAEELATMQLMVQQATEGQAACLKAWRHYRDHGTPIPPGCENSRWSTIVNPPPGDAPPPPDDAP